MKNPCTEPPAASILIVDDNPANLQVLTEFLNQKGYAPRPVLSGRMALQAIDLDPPDLILLDINMPDMDGYEVCSQIKSHDRVKQIPVIFISSLTEPLDKVRAFSSGGIDYITKPFQVDELYARIDTHLKIGRLQISLEKTIQNLEVRVCEQVKQISESQLATIFALAKLAESRDDATGKHLDRVRVFCKLLTTQLASHPRWTDILSPEFIETIFHASPLHDIGKVGIPDRILLKPGKLTPEEFKVMQTHALIGAQTLEAVAEQYPQNQIVLMGIDIALSHHEWWNGCGYPNGLSKTLIPISARIMAIADVYDALRSKRVYKPSYSHVEAVEIIASGNGTQFDPELVEIFKDIQSSFSQVYDDLVDPGVLGGA